MYLEQGNLGGSGPAEVLITGSLAIGGDLSQSLTLSYGENRTLVFDDSWSDLSSVSVAVSGEAGSQWVSADNIVVTAVPVPAALWLFGSSLAGLGVWRRKQAV
jgi:hypothetical protein